MLTPSVPTVAPTLISADLGTVAALYVTYHDRRYVVMHSSLTDRETQRALQLLQQCSAANYIIDMEALHNTLQTGGEGENYGSVQQAGI